MVMNQDLLMSLNNASDKYIEESKKNLKKEIDKRT